MFFPVESLVANSLPYPTSVTIFISKNIGKVTKFAELPFFEGSSNAETPRKIVCMEQTHSGNFAIFDEEDEYYQAERRYFKNFIWLPEVDAVVRDLTKVVEREVFVVRTADCLPLAIYVDGFVAVIHAGWRGLAEGIIGKVVAALISMVSQKKAPFLEWTFYFGPCAKIRNYEVGGEVVRSIANAVYGSSILKKDKYYLDLVSTAKAQIQEVFKRYCNIHSSEANCDDFSIDNYNLRYLVSDVCTIESQDYASFRRDGVKNSNLTIVSVEPKRA